MTEQIEPVELAQLARRCRVAAAHLRHHGVDGVAGSELQQDEDPDQDQEHGRDRGGQPPPREGENTHGDRLAVFPFR